MYHFIVTRTFIVGIQLIFQLLLRYDTDVTKKEHGAYKIMAIFFQVVSLGFLVNGFGSLVMFFEVLREELGNLWGIPKILLLKFCVGLIVIQGLIEQFAFASNPAAVPPSKNYNAEDRAQMIYCFVVVAEYSLLSYPFYWAFSKDIAPSDASPQLKNGEERSRPSEQTQVNTTFTEFMSQVLSPRDVFRNITPSNDDLATPLTQADANANSA